MIYEWFWSLMFNGGEYTHPSAHTHTLWTYTRSSGQPFMLQRPGSSWGFGALLKGLTSVMVLKVERALYIHSPHLQFLQDRDLNSPPLDYESNSLTIRTQLPRYYSTHASFLSITLLIKNTYLSHDVMEINYSSVLWCVSK